MDVADQFCQEMDHPLQEVASLAASALAGMATGVDTNLRK
jgi:hypothetical protein